MVLEIVIASMLISLVLLYFFSNLANGLKKRVKYLYQIQATQYANELIELAYNYAANHNAPDDWESLRGWADDSQYYFTINEEGEFLIREGKEEVGQFNRHLVLSLTEEPEPNRILAKALVTWEHQGIDYQIMIPTDLVNISRLESEEE